MTITSDLAPDEICPCAECPYRTEESCMCSVDLDKDTGDCRQCYFQGECESEKFKWEEI